MRFRSLLSAAIVLTACAGTETPEQMAARTQAETDSASAAIVDGNARWVRYVHANQSDSLAALFVPNGMVMPPDLPSATGHDSIAARIGPLVVPGSVLTITNQSVSASGPMAVGRGVFTFAIPAQGRTPALTVRGKYLEHWHKVDGQWRMVETIWNNDAPAPPAPPARR